MEEDLVLENYLYSFYKNQDENEVSKDAIQKLSKKANFLEGSEREREAKVCLIYEIGGLNAVTFALQRKN